MEESKKNYPSLPYNYVTLAQLQDRWLKEQERKQNEKKQQQQQEQMLQHQNEQEPQQGGHRVVVVRGRGIASRSHCAKQFRPKIRNGSASNRPAIEVSSEDNVEIGDENADLDTTGNKWKKKKKKKKKKRVKGKPRVDKERRATTEVENSEANKRVDDQKTTIKTELNDSSVNFKMEVEHKFGALSINSGSGKQNGRIRSVPNCFHHSQSQRNCGGGFDRRRREVQKRRGDKKVWVRKDGDVGEIETSSGKYT